MALPTMLAAFAEKAHGEAPWVWLMRVRLESSPAPIVFPVTTLTSEVVWPPAPDPNGETFYPFSFGFDNIEQGTEGDLPQLDVVFDNSTRMLMDVAHSTNGLEGAAVTVWLLHAEALDEPTEALRWEFEVKTSQASNQAFAMRLGMKNFFEVQTPGDRFVRNRCRRAFGGTQCGYVVNEVAAFTSCPKTVTACVERGNDEAARNLPRLHPRRFGGFPGIAAGRHL